MRKITTIAALAVVALTLSATAAWAKPGNGTPFQALWNDIGEIKTDLAALTVLVGDPSAMIDSFFDVFVEIDVHEDDVATLQNQINDLQSQITTLEGVCVDCCEEEPPACVPETEICDGIDNDCDQEVDEDYADEGVACDTGLFGVCAAGSLVCTEGAPLCVQAIQPVAEICNGLDDDCDGNIDEGGVCDITCVDLDNPATYGNAVTFDPQYGTYHVFDDVTLCQDTYDMAGKKISLFAVTGAGTFDCDGSTLIGGGPIPGTAGAVFVGCESAVPGRVCQTDITVENCAFSEFNVGISSRSATHVTLRNNVFTQMNHGISLLGVSQSTVADNTFEGITYTAIRAKDSPIFPHQDSEANTFSGNNISGSGYYGLELTYSPNNTIMSNRIVGSGIYGLRLYDSGDNTIYDNLLDNGTNVWINSSTVVHNEWNIIPVAGTNILGGAWLGGNFWSDYTGADTNADGLGDTLLPHTNGGAILNGDGDSAPLVL